MPHTPGPWTIDDNGNIEIRATPRYYPCEVTLPGGKFASAEVNALQKICVLNYVRCYDLWLVGGGFYPKDKDVEKKKRGKGLA